MALDAATGLRDVAGQLRQDAWHRAAAREIAGPDAVSGAGRARLDQADSTSEAAGRGELAPDAAPAELESAEQREQEAWRQEAEQRAVAAVARVRRPVAATRREQASQAVQEQQQVARPELQPRVRLMWPEAFVPELERQAR